MSFPHLSNESITIEESPAILSLNGKKVVLYDPHRKEFKLSVHRLEIEDQHTGKCLVMLQDLVIPGVNAATSHQIKPPGYSCFRLYLNKEQLDLLCTMEHSQPPGKLLLDLREQRGLPVC